MLRRARKDIAVSTKNQNVVATLTMDDAAQPQTDMARLRKAPEEAPWVGTRREISEASLSTQLLSGEGHGISSTEEALAAQAVTKACVEQN